MTTLVHAEDERCRLEGESLGPPNVTLDVESEGILRITLRPGSRITAADGSSTQERYMTLARARGAGWAILLQITGVEDVTRDAVRVFSEAVTVTAFAVLGSTPVDRVIAHGWRGLPAPQCPSRYSTDEPEALAWIRTVAASAESGDLAGGRGDAQRPGHLGPQQRS